MSENISIEDVTLDQLYEFLERGSISNAPPALHAYVDMLEKVRGMIQRFDIYGNRDGVVKHLVAFDGLSKYKATQICAEAIEYFYKDSEISKSSWRNFYADTMDRAINMAVLAVKDVSDLKKVIDMIKEAGAMRQVHVEDIEEIPAEMFRTPFVIYSADPEFLGLPKVDRNRLAAQIDAYPELNEKQREQIKREAQVLPIKIFPNEQEDARKS